jgi:hypothetical protein
MNTVAPGLFRWLLLLLIAAGAFFGLAPFLVPGTFASATGFTGQDVFMYRLAGAATIAYAVGLGAGYRVGWPALRIPIAATAVFNAASIGACAVAIGAGEPQIVVFVILAASLLFTAATLFYLANPPAGSGGVTPPAVSTELAPWVVGLFAIGAAAAAFFGLAALVAAGGFGHAVGYSGADDFVYRQGGAATLGAAVGGLLVLRSRTWEAARLPAIMAITFNGLSVIAAVLDLSNGGQPIAWVILGAAAVVTVGMTIAVMRQGR